MQGVIPRPDVAPLLQSKFVALASDCDDAEPEVEELAMKLEGAMMLPFVLFCDADGQFLGGFSGLVTPEKLVETLEDLAGD